MHALYIQCKDVLFDVISTLDKNKVKFAVAGGYTLALHGIVRATIDIDIVVKINLSQMKNLEKSLNDIGLKSRLPIDFRDIINHKDDYINNRNMIAWSFVDYSNPTKIIDVLINFDLHELRVDHVSVKGKKILWLA